LLRWIVIPTQPCKSCPSADQDIKRLNRSSTLLNQHVSPLLGLPAELRNAIYDFVLGGNDVHFTTSYPPSLKRLKASVMPSAEGMTGTPSTKRPFSIMRVCRQLNVETKPLPFRLNTVSGTAYGIWCPLHHSRIGPQKLGPITDLTVLIRKYDVAVGDVDGTPRMPWKGALHDIVCSLNLLSKLERIHLKYTRESASQLGGLYDGLLKQVLSKYLSYVLKARRKVGDCEFKYTDRFGQETVSLVTWD
jgi:hypothetical protein